MTTPRHNLWKVLIPALLIVAGAVIGLSVVKHFVGKAGHGPNGASNGHDSVELQEGAMVPDVLLKRFGGGETQLSAIPAKVVMVNFWATWCDGCVSELPSIIELRRNYATRGFEVLAINVDEEPEAVLPGFLKRLKIDFPVYLDSDGSLSQTFDVHGIPLTLLVAVESRKILMVQGGERDWNTEEMRNRLEHWLSGYK